MKGLVQSATSSGNALSRATRQGHKADQGFGDMLRVKPGKSGETGGERAVVNADPAPAPLSAFQLKIGHRLPDDNPLAEWLQIGERPDGDGGLEPEHDSGDTETFGLPDESLLVSPDETVLAEEPSASPETLVPSPAESATKTKAAEQAGVPPDGADRSAVVAAVVAGRQGPQISRAERPSGLAATMQDDGSMANPEDEPAARRSSASGIAERAAAPRISEDARGNASAEGEGGRLSRGIVPSEPESSPSARDARTMEHRAIATPTEPTPETPRLGVNVRVVEAHSLPAPAQVSPPAAALSSAISAAPDWMSFTRTAAASAAGSPAAASRPVRALTVQLHPAELGMVTAKLHFTGDQLSIELQVEKVDAYERLTVDREAILKAVRALGIEVDRVTVQQSQAPTANARGENPASFNGGNGRETGFSAGGSGGREGGAEGRARDGRDGDAYSPAPANGVSNGSTGRGLYI